MDKIQDYKLVEETLEGSRVRVTTYRIGSKFVCKVENAEVGVNICTAMAATAEKAREDGLSQARLLLGQNNTTQQFSEESPATVTTVMTMTPSGVMKQTPSEFAKMPAVERMNLVLNGSVRFFDQNGQIIDSGNALAQLCSRKRPTAAHLA